MWLEVPLRIDRCKLGEEIDSILSVDRSDRRGGVSRAFLLGSDQIACIYLAVDQEYASAASDLLVMYILGSCCPSVETEEI